MNSAIGLAQYLAALALTVLLLHSGVVETVVGAEAPLDLTDRAAVTKLAQRTDSVFYQSVERGDMGAFHRAISKRWRDQNTASELNDAYRLLMMLAPERRYWRGPGFTLSWPVSVGEDGMLRIQLRYPAPDEHAFIEQVYLSEDGIFKLGGYHLDFRPYNEAWERCNRAMLRHYENGDAEKALEEGRRALRVAAVLDPAKPRLTLISAGNLAEIHAQLGQFAEAGLYRFLALLIADKSYGRADMRVAEQLDQMMTVLCLAGSAAEGALCGEWSSAVRAAAEGDRDAKQRIEREMDIGGLKVRMPDLAPDKPAEDSKIAGWRAKAEAGNARAQQDLSFAYRQGRYGLDKDPVRAAEWMLKAAEQGVPSAQHFIADMYQQGTGMPQDIELALKWYHLAAEQGYLASMFSIALMHELGRVVPKDIEKALHWYRLAAGKRE